MRFFSVDEISVRLLTIDNVVTWKVNSLTCARVLSLIHVMAVPNEKITWGKLAGSTPKFIVESDATIVAPLIFNWVLGN